MHLQIRKTETSIGLSLKIFNFEICFSFHRKVNPVTTQTNTDDERRD